MMKHDEYVNDIKSFFKKIQPDEEMREYLMRLLSTCLAGSVRKKVSMYLLVRC